MSSLVSPTAAFAALPEHRKKSHRAKVGVRVRAFLDNFYVESRDAAVMAVDVDLWATALQQFSHSEIMAGFGAYFNDGPRTKSGKLTKPDPGAIKALIFKARPKPKPRPVVEDPPRPAPSPEELERSAKFVADMGFKPKRM